MWSSADAFLDLPKSVADATQFFHVQEGHATEKLFWSQFNMPRRLLLNEQMAQWAELHKMFGSAMKDVIVRLSGYPLIQDSLTLRRNISGRQLCPVYLDTGKGHPRTFYAR